MKFDAEDERVLIFGGAYEEALFLISVLEASGIPAHMVPPPKRGGVPWHSVFVSTKHAPDAMPLIEDFEKNGKKTRWDDPV